MVGSRCTGHATLEGGQRDNPTPRIQVAGNFGKKWDESWKAEGHLRHRFTTSTYNYCYKRYKCAIYAF